MVKIALNPHSITQFKKQQQQQQQPQKNLKIKSTST